MSFIRSKKRKFYNGTYEISVLKYFLDTKFSKDIIPSRPVAQKSAQGSSLLSKKKKQNNLNIMKE